jgi:hypothetical protein
VPPLLVTQRREEWEYVGGIEEKRRGRNVRVLVDEAGGVVDLVVNDHVEVFLGGVLGDLGKGEGLGHDCGVVMCDERACFRRRLAALVNESVYNGRWWRWSFRETVECGGVVA